MNAPRLSARLLSTPWAIVTLTLVAAAVYLPGALRTPVVDRDEARFAQASRQMLESVALPEAEHDPTLHAGGVVAPRVGDRPRLNKPPMIYWLQSIAVGAITLGDPSRDAIWMYRVPSVLAAMLTVLTTWWIGRRLGGPGVGLLAGLLLAVCPLFAWEARQARADQVMVACTTLAMAAMLASGRRSSVGSFALLALALAGGVLTKGPVTPMVVALAWIALRVFGLPTPITGRRLTLAFVAAIALTLPWVIALAQHVGWSELGRVWFDEVIGRSAAPKEGHAGPPGYHLVLLAALFWPGSLLTAWAIWRAARSALRARRSNADRGIHADAFLLAWIAPAWIVFELVSTKLPHYTMPLYPAVALLTARAVAIATRLARRGLSLRLGLGAPIWTAIGFAWLIVATVAVAWPGWANAAAWDQPERRMAVTGLAGAMGLVFLAVAARSIIRGRWIVGHTVAIAGLVVWHIGVAGALLPQHHELWITDRLERALRDGGWTPGDPIASIGYHEDSLVFASRGVLARLDSLEDAEAWSSSWPTAWLVSPSSMRDGLSKPWALVGQAEGFNHSRGRWARLDVLRLERTP